MAAWVSHTEAVDYKDLFDKGILFGTGNPAKLEAMKKRLGTLGIEVLGLNDIKMTTPDVVEDGSTPLENAKKKALAYYKAFR